MSLFLRGKKWHMSFTVENLLVSKSTRTANKEHAAAVEVKAKELLRLELLRDKSDRRSVADVLNPIFSGKVQLSLKPLMEKSVPTETLITPHLCDLVIGYDSEEEKEMLAWGAIH